MDEMDVARSESGCEYAVRVLSDSRSIELEHGAELARVLGWPQDRVGFVGALAGLLDIGAPMRRPRSVTGVLVGRRAEHARAIEARMRERRELAIRH